MIPHSSLITHHSFITDHSSLIFVSGIGTGIGKTLISAILAEAFEADYWKPVQAGTKYPTDSQWMSEMFTGTNTKIYPELYLLSLAASPHIAAREDGLQITVTDICAAVPSESRKLIVEGAGGLLVPLNDKEFVADLIQAMGATVILVSRNYLGSINHSLMTARVCKQLQLTVSGWIFNDQYLDYEDEIVKWTGIPKIASIPFKENPGRDFIKEKAKLIREKLPEFK
jgi:dethiobiotin synthetase